MTALHDPAVPTMVDLAFPLRGTALARDHRALLAAALARRLPGWAAQPGTGLHGVKVVGGSGALALLSARSRLVLRVPRDRADELTSSLAGATLDVGGQALGVGAPVRREMLPHRTLYAHFVAWADDDEASFLRAVDRELQRLGVSCRTVCGRRQTLHADTGPLTGFSLMLDGLKPADALRVLQWGIGPHRDLGCGLFVPHKSAAAVGA
jgi:CRISPR-associated protein Cas6